MILKEIFGENGDSKTRQDQIRKYYIEKNEKLEATLQKIAQGEPINSSPDQPYVRIFMDADLDTPQTLSFLEIARLRKNLSFILQGGEQMGPPQFGEYTIISGGRGQTTKGTTHLYIDLFPLEQFEYQDENITLKTAQEICESVLHDKRLMAQFEMWGVPEVQTSTGLVLNLEDPRPVTSLPSITPAAPTPAAP